MAIAPLCPTEPGVERARPQLGVAETNTETLFHVRVLSLARVTDQRPVMTLRLAVEEPRSPILRPN